jgi:hypothetical protein
MTEDQIDELLTQIVARAKDATARAEEADDMVGFMPGTTVQLDPEVALFLVGHIRGLTAKLERFRQMAARIEDLRAQISAANVWREPGRLPKEMADLVVESGGLYDALLVALAGP